MFRRLALLLAPLCLACSAGSRPEYAELNSDGGGGVITGQVFDAPVVEGTVTAYRLDGAKRGAAVGSGTTDATGAFSFSVGAANGPFLLAVKCGTTVDSSTYSPVSLGDRELTAIVPTFDTGSTATNVLITPVSHLTAALALHWVAAENKSVKDATAEAVQHLNNLFGQLDWTTIAPTDYSKVDGGVSVAGADEEGLLLAALSYEAKNIAVAAGVTPGVGFNIVDLTEALADDVGSDGFFDGIGGNGLPLTVPAGAVVAASGPTATKLDGQTLRITYALALSQYLSSASNRSGLAFADAQELINTLAANSDLRIFKDAGTNFDHDPPIISVTTRYQLATSFVDGGTLEYEPVGPNSLVGGSVRILLDGTDPSGVATLEGTLGGAPFPLDFVGNTGSHIQGNYTTSGDGPLSIAWVTTDNRGNQGTGSLTYLVDNTPPEITFKADQPRDYAYYSSTIPIDATATDANGISTFTADGLDGFDNQSGVLYRIAGTWSIPSSVSEGRHDFTFVACDPVHNCTTSAAPIYVDRLPPQISFVTTPRQYTAQQQLTVVVKVTDTGSGVAHVWLQNGAAAAVEALSQGNGTYAATLTLPVGPSAITVYAVDAAGNDSRSAGQFGFNVIYDDAPPSVGPVSTASYIPEDAMGIATNPDGSPVMPAQYTFPSGTTPVAVGPGVTVNKASTRLSWGVTAPTAAQLLSQDHATLNVPLLAYQVGYAPQTDSPVTSVRYTVHCSSNCGASWTDATGDFLRDDTQTASLRYLLPITIETVPALAQLASGGSALSVTITTRDGAGNVGTADGGSFTFRVLGAPLVVREDTSYPSSTESMNVYLYPSTSSTYLRQFSSYFSELHYVRYIVQNPAQLPVQLSASVNQHATGGTMDSWATWESWNTGFDPFSGEFPSSYTAPDGDGPYDSSYYKHQCPGFSSNLPATNCSGSFTAWEHLPQTSGMTCDTSALPSSQTGSSHVEASGALSPYVYISGSTRANSTAALIPAANGTTPGFATLYIGRDPSVSRQTEITTSNSYLADAALWQNIDPTGTRTGWQLWKGDYWQNDPDGSWCGTNTATGTNKYNWDYPGLRHWTYLTSAKFVLQGSVSVSTRGANGSSAFGDTRALTTQSFNRSVNN